jgi:hypothetical protein
VKRTQTSRCAFLSDVAVQSGGKIGKACRIN